MPRIEQTNFTPVPGRCDLRIQLRNRVNGAAQEVQGLGPPAAEGFYREGHKPPTGERPRWVPPMLAVRGSSRRRAIAVCRGVEPSAALRVSHHDVPVDQGVSRWTAEPAVQASLLNNDFTPGIGPSPRPCRLVDLGGANEPGGAPNPSEDVTNRVVPPNHEAPNFASQGVKPVGIESLPALRAGGPGSVLLCRASAPLVPAPVPLRPLRKASSKAEAGADLELEISEARGSGGRRREEPSPCPGTATGPQASPRSQRQ